MAQFDLFRNPRGRPYPVLLDVQADLLSALATRVVVPMARLSGYGVRPITLLNPTVKVAGVEYVLVFQELAAIPASALGKPIGSLASHRSALVAAIDLLFTGI
jgi:toxin CcdB